MSVCHGCCIPVITNMSLFTGTHQYYLSRLKLTKIDTIKNFWLAVVVPINVFFSILCIQPVSEWVCLYMCLGLTITQKWMVCSWIVRRRWDLFQWKLLLFCRAALLLVSSSLLRPTTSLVRLIVRLSFNFVASDTFLKITFEALYSTISFAVWTLIICSQCQHTLTNSFGHCLLLHFNHHFSCDSKF